MAIIQTQCTCGTLVEIRTSGDAETIYRKDGKQAVYPGESGYSIFRCRTCLEPLSQTVPEFAYDLPQVGAEQSIEDMVEQLLDHMDDAETQEEITAALIDQAETIRAISKACESSSLFERSAKQYVEFKENLESNTAPEDRLFQSWLWLLNRLANAPSRLHFRSAMRLCMPLVAAYLPEATSQPQ